MIYTAINTAKQRIQYPEDFGDQPEQKSKRNR